MASPIERHNVDFVARHDLDGRPPFKLAIQRVGDRWYLYLAHFWHSGWSILDVTDPAAPELVRFIEGPENTMTLQVQVADGLMVTSLERPRENWGPIDGPRMDPAKPYETGAYIWDVETDPESPSLLGHWESGGGGTHRNHYDGGDYVYMTANFPGFTGKLLAIVYISDPAAPEEIGRWWYPGQGPDEEATAQFYLHGPAYPGPDGDRAYLSYGTLGLVVLDISDKTAPTQVGRVDFGDLGSGLGVHSAVPIPETELVLVNSEAINEASPLDGGDPLNFAYLVDVSEDGTPGFDGMDPHGPKVVSNLPLPRPDEAAPYDSYYERAGRFGPHNQHHFQYQPDHRELTDVIPMTYFTAGLRLFDISDPIQPEEVGHYVPENPTRRINDLRPATGQVSQLEDVLVDARGVIYCSDPNLGLLILKSNLL